MDCELNKPLCKRKLLMKPGPFEQKKTCVLSKKTQCPLSAPQCPLLPEAENNCPLSKVIKNKNKNQICPLAQPGCPCDPAPPCPLAYDNDLKDNGKSQESQVSKSRQIKCPASYPVYGQCPKSVKQNDINKIATPCPNVLQSKGKKLKNDEQNKVEKPTLPAASLSSETISESSESKESKESLISKSYSTKSKEKLVSDGQQPNSVIKKNLTVPDCTLSSTRPLPCSECLAELLSLPENLQNCELFSKSCPYLKIVNMCEDTCLCENVPSIDIGPPCPFAPKPCPCCAAVRCPLTKVPDCPLVSQVLTKKVKTQPCRCYCPIVPPPCSLNIPPQCAMHNNNNPAPCPLKPPSCKCDKPPSCKCDNKPPSCKCVNKLPSCKCDEPPSCKCDKQKNNCPLVPDLYPSCPLQPCYQTEECYNMKPQPNLELKPQVQKLPSLLVSPNMICSLDDTLEELNKLCTCDEPPFPEIVNMIPTTFLPKQKNEQPTCIAKGDKNDCPLECPCEPPRTFHVPTCPKKNPPCMQSFPISKNEGELVCPFSPRCCPLGCVCPFPVKGDTKKTTQSQEVNEPPQKLAKMSQIPKQNPQSANTSETKKNVNPGIKSVNNSKKKETTKTNNVKPLTKIPVKETQEEKSFKNPESKTENNKPNATPSTGCPLSKIPGGEKKCPYAPSPCPLDPIKPIIIKEPKVCPFAPEPDCPLMPKPLCPAKSMCLLEPTAPLPECPYAPPGCPLAPKKLCLTETPMNYECPCPKPKPCTCSTFQCPCPKPSNNCPCPNSNPGCPCPDIDSGCPCSDLVPGCPCPVLDSRCTCSNLDPGCPCPNLEPGCPCPDPNEMNCPCPEPKTASLLTPKPKCPLALPVDPNSPLSFKNSNKGFDEGLSMPEKPKNLSEETCSCTNLSSGDCLCRKETGTNCPCSMLTKKSSCSCNKPVLDKPSAVKTLIDELKKAPKELDCPVKIPPCEKFPEGRCPMEDLGLCNCDYPCPPCLEPAKCSNTQAPKQYCVKKKCCMGLTIPPVTSDDWKHANRGRPLSFYKFAATKPGREETKYHIEILSEPPNKYPFGPPKVREHPNWHIVKYGTGYEKCQTVAEILQKRKPSADISAQFDPKDNPMDSETRLVMENRENQAMLEKMVQMEL